MPNKEHAPLGLVLEGDHVKAAQVLMLMFAEAAARFPKACDGFVDARGEAKELIRRMRTSDQNYLDVLAGDGVAKRIELDSQESLTLVRLILRSIIWIPEFDDIHTLTGYTRDEVMQFYLDLKNALGLFGVDDGDMALSTLSSPLDTYPALPRYTN